jgi:hypothetical protein
MILIPPSVLSTGRRASLTTRGTPLDIVFVEW